MSWANFQLSCTQYLFNHIAISYHEAQINAKQFLVIMSITCKTGCKVIKFDFKLRKEKELSEK